MSTRRTAHRAWPGWLAGVLAATGTLIALGFAIGVGSIVGAIVDPPNGARHAGIVAFHVGALTVGYVVVLQSLARSATSGVTTNAAVDLPRRRGPAVYPPSR